MRLAKDLLIIDFESTGKKIQQDSIIQLAGTRLKKENLLETGFFNGYARSSFIESILKRQAEDIGTDFLTLKNAPRPAELLRAFAAEFKDGPTLAVPSVEQWEFLSHQLTRNNIKTEFDPRVFDLWSIYYEHSIRLGFKVMPSLSTLTGFFRIPSGDVNNAFTRVRLHAAVLRKLWLSN